MKKGGRGEAQCVQESRESGCRSRKVVVVMGLLLTDLFTDPSFSSSVRGAVVVVVVGGGGGAVGGYCCSSLLLLRFHPL